MTDTLDDIISGVNPSPSGALDRFGSVGNISGILINLVWGVGFSIGILAIAYSALLYILSGGNPDKTKRAWNAFLYGVIGTALAIGVFALKNIVVRGFGVDSPDIENVPGF